ncbi:TonB-dependent receptor [Microvirga sp. SRT01]|uniref:TonB-dependent receptor n=1 Tax=Sphingomonas longa TaxID=2778730 RepID=A0ABS2D2W0_9SPHN|nr:MULTISPECIES: TonB-dependent receptor [Alphaproteobacteria]MBM6575262.1 TonB-dependent receptor [Sphingomonas sp. BT552]MBR7708312.1 TonB-dependent receptor [Microvirga sp. SRT01]
MISSATKWRALGGSVSTLAVLLAMSAPATAQNAPAPAQDAANAEARSAEPTTQVQNATDATGAATDGNDEIVVTGSLLRQTDSATPSPVTTITAANLDARGINTVQGAIQSLASNNGPALTNSFTANGAFAGGASAVSLRGLSTNSTLVLFDGLRAAYYPLADDATRNFVDLNTIPDDIVDRIEVLRDGASSSYGADAIAGVVNVITKRKFNGISGRAEAGISQDGVAANQRLTLTAGTGDLDEKGYNAYISGFFFRSEAVYNRDLPYPFNSADQRGVGTGGPNNIANGLGSDGLLPNNGVIAGANFFVRPATGTTAVPGSRYQLLTPGCLNGTPYNTTDADRAQTNNGAIANVVCQQDLVNQYGVVSPNIERFGASARFTGKVGDNAEAYFQVNFQQSSSNYSGDPSVIRGNAPAGILFPQFSTSSAAAQYAPGSAPLTLPVYVCPRGTVNCGATNGTLNPNNPFAAAGQTALLLGTLPNSVTYNATRNRVYRAAAGVQGTIDGGWNYRVDATAMHTDLRRTQAGYVYIQHLLDVIADGSYNFLDPSQNSQATRDYLTPTNIADSSSDLYQLQASVSKELFQLPGGAAQLAFGGSVFYEAIDAPSANPDINGPTQRYFTINAFGTSGNRTVSSAFGELQLPIVEQFLVNASGRYDHYSSGQSNFSPKIGAKFTPFRQLAVRGTWSRGFRIPSFGEANALPTTGYVTNNATLFNDTYLAQYGCTVATFADCPTYIRSGSYGQTTLASQNLNPEKSRSFTAGIVFEPIRNVALTVDFFDIKKTGAITTLTAGDALAAYYAGETIPDGFEVIPDAVGVGFENATPRVGLVRSQLVNANTIHSQGLDIGGTARFDLTDGLRYTISGEGSILFDLSTTFPGGRKEKYVGTLGNYNLTAGSGTPRWRANVTQTLDIQDQFSLSGTVNYVAGYNLSAEDQGGVRGDGGLAVDYLPENVDGYITVDLVGTVKVTDKFSFYFNVLNLLNDLPPLDPATYGAYLYNPVQAGEGIFGRQFRAGVKFGF